MSLKSREKSIQRQQERRENIFARQKAAAAIARKWTADYLYAALFFSALMVLQALVAKDDPEDIRNFWRTMPLLSVLIIGLLVIFWKLRRFLRTMEKVLFSSIEEREFVCTRVRLMRCPTSRFADKLVGIILIAKDGERYRYILPQAELASGRALRRWKEQCVGKKLRCTCYSGTTNVESVVLLSKEQTMHNMKLNAEPFAMIKSGKKTIELRLFDEKRKRINVGDSIVFTNNATGETLTRTVVKLHRFESFDALYKALPLLQCGYTKENVGRADPSDMERYYSAQERAHYGVIGIELC